MLKKASKLITSPVVCIALIAGIVSCSCQAFAPVGEKADLPAPKGLPIVVLQDGAICYPTELHCITPQGNDEDRSALGIHALALGPDAEGTWLYTGTTVKGTAAVIITCGASTPLHKSGAKARLEIRADSHPSDLRPSEKSMASQARFGFTVLEGGEPVSEPVPYRAARFDGGSDSNQPKVNRETMMGKGRVYINEPGLWWITAEKILDDGSTYLASITFTVPDKPGPDQYAAFTRDGKYLETPDQIAMHLSDAEVIFVGENHNDPVAHLLELEILAAVHKARENVALSLEMFERDVQPVLDGYLAGLFTESHFLKASRPWPEYTTDYRPMVEYARKNDLPVVAANAPRRIVNLVTRKGPEALADLPEEELKWIPSADYHIPTEGRYVDKLNNLFSGFAKAAQEEGLPGPRKKRDWLGRDCPELSLYNEQLVAEDKGAAMKTGKMPPAAMMMHAKKSKGNPSQSLWDATMAYSISAFLERAPGSTVVQVNGSFHSNESLGTVEQLLRYRPGTRVAVISIVPDQAFPAFDKESLGVLGDVVIVTDPAWQPED